MNDIIKMLEDAKYHMDGCDYYDCRIAIDAAIEALQAKSAVMVPKGYVLVLDTTESLSTDRLSDKLRFWRAERPDEWTMDEFIRDAQILEAMLHNE